jgi:hypothetical protein
MKNARGATISVVIAVGTLAIFGAFAATMAALPYGEKLVTSDGNIVVTGASEVELLADGNAKASIRRGDDLARFPGSASGDTAYTLVEGQARKFTGTQLRHVYIDLDTATYVIVTWR